VLQCDAEDRRELELKNEELSEEVDILKFMRTRLITQQHRPQKILAAGQPAGPPAQPGCAVN